jgi:hypothetical protein
MRRYLIITSKLLVFVAFICSFTIGYQLWMTGIEYAGIEKYKGVDGVIRTNQAVHMRRFSDVSHSGVVPLVVPVILTLVAMWASFNLKVMTLLVTTVLFSVLWFLAGFSIGMMYTAVLILLMIASTIQLMDLCLNKGRRSDAN